MNKRLRKIVKSVLPVPIISMLREARKNKRGLPVSSGIDQKKTLLQYRDAPVEFFNKSGFKVHSEYEEDGLILFVFSKIGFANKKGVEICCGTGDECMLTNLVLNHDFQGLMFDGDKLNIAMARYFFKKHSDQLQHDPILAQEWITRDNINQLILKYGYKGEIDFFSLDVDGVDYYLMKSLDVVSPRLVICETNNVVPANLSITVPYEDGFYRSFDDPYTDHRGVSTLAMVNLMKEKGYRLIGHHKDGFNLLFLRNDLGADIFPEIDHKVCFENDFTRKRLKDWEKVAGCEWVNV